MAITAGMKDGTGLNYLDKTHPDHLIDVGIAEEYAATFAAGMAKGGLKPVVAIYSTFLQRAYDEIMQDVCLQMMLLVFLMLNFRYSLPLMRKQRLIQYYPIYIRFQVRWIKMKTMFAIIF